MMHFLYFEAFSAEVSVACIKLAIEAQGVRELERRKRLRTT